MAQNTNVSQIDDSIVLKIVMIGDSGVGKTNLLSRYCKDTFTTDTKPTIGVEFTPYQTTCNDMNVTVHLWDTAGQEKYRGITSSYYKDAHGICLVFDISNKNSFLNLDIWLDEIRNFSSEDVQIILMANKTDLADKRRVSTSEAEAYAETQKLFYMEVSAKTNEGGFVEKAFAKVIEEAVKHSANDAKRKQMERASRIRKTAGTLAMDGSSVARKGCC